jgi:tellurite resistance protein TerC
VAVYLPARTFPNFELYGFSRYFIDGMNDIQFPVIGWAIFFAIILTALAFDLGIASRKAHAPSKFETAIWSVVWVSLAIIFNIYIYWQFGSLKGKEFFTGYLIELSLSIDNLFVFLLIFSFFKVPAKYQHRVLFWGIFMALVMRMAMIFAGAELVERFHAILYLFGAFLVYTGVKMFFSSEDQFNPEESWMVTFTTRFIRISKHYDGENFFIRKDGKLIGTLLLLVLIVINVADLIFAVDSIPAIFGITTDRFIVYTSNIFAILGLRTFFFLLLRVVEKFHYLQYGLAFVLTFIGIKMLLPLAIEVLLYFSGTGGVSGMTPFLESFHRGEYNQLMINISLAVVVAALSVSVALSLIFPVPPPENVAAEAENTLEGN